MIQSNVNYVQNGDAQMAEIAFYDWLFGSIASHGLSTPTKIAMVEEVDEPRCVTYEELVTGFQKTANYMSYHGVKSGDRILMCMENSVEYVFYHLGACFLGAVPIIINPNHLESLEDINFTSAVVDFQRYNKIIKCSKESLQRIQCVFVLTYDISEIIVASNLWVIDGFGYLSFSNKLNSDETLFTTSNCVIVQESRDLNRYVAHSNKSSFHLCFDFYNQLLDMLPNNLRHEWINHLIYNGFHNHEVLPYLFFILVRGDTCVLTQFTETNYNASLVDKIVGLVERYQIPIFFTDTNLLKWLINMKIYSVYNLNSIQIIANTGSVFSVSLGKHFEQFFKAILIQVYSSAEFGVASFGIFQPSSKEHLVDCGQSIHGMAIKIANIKTEKEAESGEWGQIILKGRQLFSNYLGLSRNEDRFGKHWYKTGDYGMIDENKVLHFQGPISKLITAQDKMVSSVLVETILSQNDMIEDAIVTKNNEELWCGLLLKNKNQRPTAKKLERILQKNEINLTFKKVMILDIIPNGNIEHNVLAYLHTDRHSIELEEAMVSCI